MCGICGIIALDVKDPVDEQALRRMTAALEHRGPDDGDIWISPKGYAGLGHRRLSIIDLSPAGKQPMILPDQSTAVVLNGEIYNYQTIRQNLLKRSHNFRSQTDTEVLLHLYEESGEGLVELIEGDYAFGIWDQNKLQLTLTRDRAGVKPLYYTVSQGYFLFSSEIRSLLASGMVPHDIDDTALYHYLSYLTSPPSQSLIKNVSKLEPGSMLMVGPERSVTKKRYWDPFPGQMTDLPTNDNELQDMFEELFENAVEKRLMSDVPIGVLFSGGVDSTLNAGVFKDKLAGKDVHSFTVSMPSTENNEGDQAAEMARHLGTIHHNVDIYDSDVLDNLDKITTFQDEPVSDPVCLPLYFVTQLAREHGVTVLQAGEGADELFCGYSSYMKYLAAYNKYWTLLDRLPRLVSKTGGAVAKMFASGKPRVGRIADILQRHAQDYPLFLSSAIGYSETNKPNILAPDFLHSSQDTTSWDVVLPHYERLYKRAPEASFLQQMTFIELNLRLPELLLMRVDKMAMAHAIEVRVPFLDHHLIEFAMSVPDSFKLRGNVPKAPVKQMATRYAAKEKIYQKKTGFGAPIRQWLKGEIGKKFRDLLALDDAEHYFNTPHIRSMLDARSWSKNEAFQLWVIFNFLNWKNMVLSD